jgi:EamA domain-containing membrane protein RarD
MIIALLFQSIQPWIFLKGLNSSSMTILNLTWDLVSDILVTLMGILYFREEISGLKMIGVLFAFVSVSLFALDKQKN